MKLILILLLSMYAFASTRYVTPNFVVQNSELYCLSSDKIIIYPVGDILDGEFAQNCSYNKESIEMKLQKINEYNESLEGRIYSGLHTFLFGVLFGIIILCFILLFYIIRSIWKD